MYDATLATLLREFKSSLPVVTRGFLKTVFWIYGEKLSAHGSYLHVMLDIMLYIVKNKRIVNY